MEPKFQSSFIPKGPLATTGTVPGFAPKRSVLGFLAKGLFIIALVLSVVVFGYKYYLKSDINKMSGDLETAKAALEPATITEISNLNTRIISTQALLANHVVLSPLFTFLEGSTLKTVRFLDFSYESTDKGLALTMRGQARGYAAVALQSDIFSKTKYFKNPVFSNLDLDSKGNVIFSFSAGVDPSIVSYKAAISGNQIVIPVATSTPVVLPVATTTSTSTPKIGSASSSQATTTKR